MKTLELIKKLDESRDEFLNEIKDIDMETMVYPEGGWKVKDVMINIAFWDFEAAKSLEAFLKGEEYFTPDFSNERIDKINKDNFERTKNSSYDQVLTHFQNNRKLMVQVLEKVGDIKLKDLMMCPWKSKSTVEHFVKEMVKHENEHLDDILKNTSPEAN